MSAPGRATPPKSQPGGPLGPSTPPGHFRVPPVPPEEHSIEGPVPQPPGGSRGGPAEPTIHLHHQGERFALQGVGDRVPVPGPIAWGALCPPRRLRPRLLCLWRWRRTEPRRRRGSGHPRWFRPRLSYRGGGDARGTAVRVGGRLVPHVGVDVVEKKLVVVGVVRQHLPDTGGDPPHRLDILLRGRPAPVTLPAHCRSPPGPTFRPACPRGAMSPFSPLPMGPLPPPSPRLGRTPSPLPSGPCRGSRPLSTAPLPVLLTPVSLPCPCTCPRPLNAPWPAPCAPLPLVLAPCPCPCVRPWALPLAPASFQCPCPCPALCPASLRPLPALWPAPCACPPPLLLALVPCQCPCPLSLPCAPWPVPCVRPWALPLSPSAPRPALLRPVPCPARAPSPLCRIKRRPSRCRCSCGSVMPGGVHLGARGRRGHSLPSGKAAWGGYNLEGLVRVWLGLVWTRYLAPSLPSAATAAAPNEALSTPVGPVSRESSLPRAAARPSGDAARLTGPADSAPCAPGASSGGEGAGATA